MGRLTAGWRGFVKGLRQPAPPPEQPPDEKTAGLAEKASPPHKRSERRGSK